MKRIYFHLFFLFVLFSLFSCTKSNIPATQSGNWVTESQLNGPARSEAVSFVIGNFAYVGTGWDGLNTRYSDFWKYDPVNNIWSQVNGMPDSAARSSAIAFTAAGNGYVGTGYDGYLYKKDFYEFNPDSNAWYRRADFAGGARYEAVAFGIGNFGYAGTGFDGSNAQKDFYKYDPSSDTWTDIGFSGNKRYGAVTFIYNSKAYLVTGINSGTQVNDFWVFDPAASSANWTELRHITNYSTESYDDSYTNIVRNNASAFVIDSKAYLSTGENGIYLTSTWQYDITNDLWYEKTPFEGPATSGAVGFNVTNLGYISTGRSSPGQAGASDYLRQFQPDVVENPNDN